MAQSRLFNAAKLSFTKAHNLYNSTTRNTPAKMTIGATVLSVPMTMWFSPKPRPTETYVVSIGSLLELNYNATIAAFKKLAEKENKPFKLNPETYQAIFTLDDGFKMGDCDAETFRKVFCGILDINPTVEEFDHAWNAMLGDPVVMQQRLAELKKLPVNLILMSGTNPIHAQKLRLDKMPEPMLLSYQQKCGVDCWQRVFTTMNVAPENTTFVITEHKSDSAAITERNKQRTPLTEQGLRSVGAGVCKCSGKKGLMAEIQDCIDAKKLQQKLPGDQRSPLPFGLAR
jgi:hypothetical protein